MFDTRALRDNQAPDERGQTIPREATHGQVFWSVDGPENLVLIGRAEQVDVVAGLSSTNACQQCCPSSFGSAFCNPSNGVGLPGFTTQLVSFQQNISCYGQFLAPFQRGANAWTSSDPLVATVDATGVATAQSFGNTLIQGSWQAYQWDSTPDCSFDPENCMGTCLRSVVDALADFTCDVAGIRGFVINPPVANDGDAVVAGQQFTLQAEIIKPSGERVTEFSGNAAFSVGGTQMDGELIPTGLAISSGVGTTIVLLKAVPSTGAAGRSYHLTFSSPGAGSTNFGGFFNVWFSVIASREGLVGGTTACNHTIVANDHFVALPSTGLCNTNVVVKNGNNSENTSVLDVGPWFPHAAPTSGNPCIGGNDPYWTTTGVPRAESSPCSNGAGIDLADGTFANLGLTGNARILWRFRP